MNKVLHDIKMDFIFANGYKNISTIYNTIYNACKAPHRYDVQVSDTTMITIAASLFGQQANRSRVSCNHLPAEATGSYDENIFVLKTGWASVKNDIGKRVTRYYQPGR